MALENLLRVIEFLVPIAKAIPIVGSRVEGSLEAVKQIVLLAQDVKNHKQDARDLAQEATRWIHTIVLELERANPDTLKGAELGVNELHKTLKEMLSTSLQHTSARITVKAVLKSSADREEIRRLRDKLDEMFKRFMAASHLRIEIALKELIATFDREMLEKKLSPVHLVRYDARGSPRGCLASTREDILLKLQSWAEEESSGLSIFWLTGLAGTGKSTIAKSFCEWLAPRQKLLLTFFASGQDAQRRDPLDIAHTFAYELSRKIDQPAVHRQILTAVKSEPEITARELEEQVDRLISQPLALALATEPFPFFVLDALDECYKIDGVEGGSLVSHLVSQLSEYPVKIFVTSRQEDSLVQMFRKLEPHSTIRLQDLKSSEVEADVTRYLEDRFAHLRRTRPRLPTDWPPPHDLETLVKRTGHLFVFASTVMNFISHPRHSPQARLQQLLDRHATSAGSFAELDMIYAKVLETAVGFDESHHSVDPDLCHRVRDLLGAIVHVQKPLSIESLALLLGFPESEEVELDVKALSAVLLLTNTNGPDSMYTDGTAAPALSAAVVQVFHPSFPDFLTDQARARCCLNGRFFVKPDECHEKLLIGCMRVMNSLPTVESCGFRDILRVDFETSGDMPPALSYACMGYTFHLTRIRPRPILVKEMEQFSHSNMLRRWIISRCALLRQLTSGPSDVYGDLLPSGCIRSMLEWCKIADEPQAVQAFELRLRDALPVTLIMEAALEVVKRFQTVRKVFLKEQAARVMGWTEQALTMLECSGGDMLVSTRVNVLCQVLHDAASCLRKLSLEISAQRSHRKGATIIYDMRPIEVHTTILACLLTRDNLIRNPRES